MLTNHKNLVSTFCSTLLYALIPSITFLAAINTSQTLLGRDSIKCNSCRFQQMQAPINSSNSTSSPLSTVATTTSSNVEADFVCTQNDGWEVVLLIISLGMKCLDHLVSGYLFLRRAPRPAGVRKKCLKISWISAVAEACVQ